MDVSASVNLGGATVLTSWQEFSIQCTSLAMVPSLCCGPAGDRKVFERVHHAGMPCGHKVVFRSPQSSKTQ
jgi:hypothetical protein